MVLLLPPILFTVIVSQFDSSPRLLLVNSTVTETKKEKEAGKKS